MRLPTRVHSRISISRPSPKSASPHSFDVPPFSMCFDELVWAAARLPWRCPERRKRKSLRPRRRCRCRFPAAVAVLDTHSCPDDSCSAPVFARQVPAGMCLRTSPGLRRVLPESVTKKADLTAHGLYHFPTGPAWVAAAVLIMPHIHRTRLAPVTRRLSYCAGWRRLAVMGDNQRAATPRGRC